MTTKITYDYDAAGYLVQENIDLGNDGNIDAVTNHTIALNQYFDIINYETYQYDGYGNLLTRSHFEFDSDGSDVSMLVYDAIGNLLQWQYDEEGDGQPEIIVTNEYDETNNLINTIIEGDNSLFADLSQFDPPWKSFGMIDPSGNNPNYEYDANGNVVQINGPYGPVYFFYDRVASQIDRDFDTQIDAIIQYNYTLSLPQNLYYDLDATPVQITLESAEVDTDLDGLSDRVITYNYGVNHQLLSESHDTDLDGITDDVLVHHYDTNGVLDQSFFDRGNDGVVDQIQIHTVNSDGQRVMTLIEELSDDAIANGKVDGTSGNDFFQGGIGRDRIFAKEGNDVAFGGDSADYIELGTGNDFAMGGSDDDRLYGEAGDDVLFGGTGEDFLRGDDGRDLLFGDAGADDLRGGNGDDVLYGGADNDKLFGNDGNDILNGGDGDDTLYGDDGDDILRGGLGNDRLFGKSGADTFVLAFGEGSDLIVDFEIDLDQLGLAGGLTFGQLDFVQAGADTEISVGGELLVTLHATNADLISDSSHFVTV